ncbi:hypothetical protein niasHT_026819 [Heterodera trifolii]|uniref:Glycine-rich protein n=1 Tax=Heterodera trifolii TaxID=157864 RepID=A0ABD2KL05_9BILA
MSLLHLFAALLVFCAMFSLNLAQIAGTVGVSPGGVAAGPAVVQPAAAGVGVGVGVPAARARRGYGAGGMGGGGQNWGGGGNQGGGWGNQGGGWGRK